MRYKLQTLQIIPNDLIEKLESLNIFDSDNLLFHASTPKRRKNLSNLINISEDDLLKWASISDLVRIKGIGVKIASKLVKHGEIENVGGFIFAINKRLDKENQRNIRVTKPRQEEIVVAAKAFCDEIEDEVNPHLIANAYDEALELVPRLSLHDEDKEKTSFETEINSIYKVSVRETLLKDLEYFRPILGVITVVLIPIATCWALAFLCSIGSNIITGLNAGEKLNREMATWFFNIGLGILFFLIGMLLLNLLMSYWAVIEKKLVLFLFNYSGYRQSFFIMKDESSKTGEIKSNFLKGGLYVVGLLLATIAIIGMVLEEISGANALDNIFSWSIPIVGIIFGVGLSIPTLNYYSKLKQKNRVNEDAIFRFLIVHIIGFFQIPIMYYLIVKIFLPLGVYLYGIIHGTPSVQISANIESIRPFIEGAISGLIWMILIVFGLNLIVPYLYLGEWKRGVFYIFVLSLSFYADYILQLKSLDWFYVERGSIPAIIIIAFIVFSNAVFFDWLYDFYKTKKRLCEYCGENTSVEDHFCVNCGLPQEIE